MPEHFDLNEALTETDAYKQALEELNGTKPRKKRPTQRVREIRITTDMSQVVDATDGSRRSLRSG